MIEEKASIALNKRLIKNSLHTGLALVFVGLVPFAFNFLIARTFGKETLGTINISLSFCLIITVFVTNYFGTAGTKFLAEYRGRKNLEHFILVFKITFLGPLIILTIINLVLIFKWEFFSRTFSLPPELFTSLLAYIFIRSFYIIIRRVFYGIDLVKSYALNEIISAIVMLISLVLVCSANRPDLLIECYLLSYTLFCLLGLKTLLGKFKSITNGMISDKEFNTREIVRSFSNYGAISMIGTVASTSTGYISIIVTGIYLTHADAGLYSSVLAIVSVLMFVPKLFTQVFFPEFSKLFGEGDKQKIFQIFNQTTRIMLTVSTFICLIVFVFSEEIISIFGKDFSNGSLILRIILPSLFVRMISIPFVSFLSGTKYVIYPNIGGLIILAISTLFWLILVPKYQLIGITTGYTIGIIIGIGYQIIMAILKIKKFNLNY